MFGLSEVTIRSDLDVLADSGGLQRVHGGAIIRDPSPVRNAPSRNPSAPTPTRRRPSAAPLRRWCSSGETIILDVGSTTSAIARALVKREDLYDVVVFTNGITPALELEAAIPRFNVVVTGGTLRPLQHSLVDPMATHILEEVNVSTAFLGCNGVHPIEGVTNVNLPEAAIEAAHGRCRSAMRGRRGRIQDRKHQRGQDRRPRRGRRPRDRRISASGGARRARATGTERRGRVIERERTRRNASARRRND